MGPVGVLGASGGVGSRVVRRLLDQGTEVRCQTRSAARLARFAGRVQIHVFDPVDGSALRTFVRGCSAIVYAIGIDRLGATDLFSTSTAALIAAMRAEGVARLVAVTGVGAGDTRGHGGFVYDRIVFPLFTRDRYRDKDRQEASIARSGLRWTIVRPAPFKRSVGGSPLEIHREVAPTTVLSAITRDEVARFIVDELNEPRYVGARPFIGHR